MWRGNMRPKMGQPMTCPSVDILQVTQQGTALVWYDTIQWTVLTCAQKLTSSQLNLLHGTKQKRIIKKPKSKNGDAQRKRSGKKKRSARHPNGVPDRVTLAPPGKNTNMTEPCVCSGYADGTIVFARRRQCALPLNYAQYDSVVPQNGDRTATTDM